MPPKSIAKEVLFLIKMKRNHPEVFHEIVDILDRTRVSLSRGRITTEDKREIDKETVQEISQILLQNKLPKDAEEFSGLYEKSPELRDAIVDSWISEIYDEPGTLMEEPRYPRYDAEFMRDVVYISRNLDRPRVNATKTHRHSSKGGKRGSIRKRRTSKKTRQSKKQRKYNVII